MGPDLSALAMAIEKTGDNAIPGLTDKELPRRLGPKRASKIRRIFKLNKKDDIRKYVVRREVEKPSGKKFIKSPKI